MNTKVWKPGASKTLKDRERGMLKSWRKSIDKAFATRSPGDLTKAERLLRNVDAFLASCDEEREEMSPGMRKLLDIIIGKVKR